MDDVSQFFPSGQLVRSINSMAITLIPKVTRADKLSQFRPVILFHYGLQSDLEDYY